MFPALDRAFARRQFPAFEEAPWSGQIHFDNAGGSFACRPVIDRLARYYRETKVQPYGVHPLSQRAGAEMDAAIERLAGYLGVNPDHVHLGPSTSQNSYVLAQAFAGMLSPGDEIIVTNQDHEANSGVWRRLAERGMVVREWAVDGGTGTLDPRGLDALLNPRTRLVAFTHCSNILGQINPVADLCARVHAAGALAVVDGVSFAGHGLPDVAALGADIYLFSLYKVYGPHQGVMVLDPGLLERLGNQGHYFNAGQPRKRLVPAGPDHAQVAASLGVAEYFDTLHTHHFPGGTATIAQRAADVRRLLREAELGPLERLLGFLRADPRVRLLGPANAGQRAATVAVQTLQAPARAIAERLAANGINAGAGHFYAARLLDALGIAPAAGVLRLSFVHTTTDEEMSALIDALDQAL